MCFAVLYCIALYGVVNKAEPSCVRPVDPLYSTAQELRGGGRGADTKEARERGVCGCAFLSPSRPVPGVAT